MPYSEIEFPFTVFPAPVRMGSQQKRVNAFRMPAAIPERGLQGDKIKLIGGIS